MNAVIGYPFVSHVDQNKRPTIETPSQFLHYHYTIGYCSGSINELLRDGTYKHMGYIYDFRPYLIRFLYKQDGRWQEGYAPNKTKLKSSIYGGVSEIIEITQCV